MNNITSPFTLRVRAQQTRLRRRRMLRECIDVAFVLIVFAAVMLVGEWIGTP